MRVLVTGGSGFIGSHIVEHFQGKAEVRVLDNLRSGYLKNLEGLDHEFIEGSITDRAVVPKIETMLPEPKSPYAITKLAGEYYCEMFSREGKLDTGVMRYFNVFGPQQDPKSAYAAAVPIFIYKAVKNETITIFGDGQQTRDFIYVKDIVAANVFLAMNQTPSGFFNVAYGGRLTINELATKIIALTNSSSTIEYAPVRAGDVKHSMASVEKIKAVRIRRDTPVIAIEIIVFVSEAQAERLS